MTTATPTTTAQTTDPVVASPAGTPDLGYIMALDKAFTETREAIFMLTVSWMNLRMNLRKTLTRNENVAITVDATAIEGK